jgi:hypothetical protein
MCTTPVPLTAPGGPSELETRNGPDETRQRQPPLCPDHGIEQQQPRRNSWKDLHIVSQNIRGAKGFFDLDGATRDLSKIETLSRLMHENGIDVFLLQETWLIDDWTTSIAGITIIHHGPAEAPCSRGSGGVAIMLGPRAQQAWAAAGQPDPYRPGNIVGNTT